VSPEGPRTICPTAAATGPADAEVPNLDVMAKTLGQCEGDLDGIADEVREYVESRSVESARSRQGWAWRQLANALDRARRATLLAQDALEHLQGVDADEHKVAT
jgi:hypothetical protein